MAQGRSFKQLWWLALLLLLSPIIAAVIARVLTGPLPEGKHRGWGRPKVVETADAGREKE